MSIKHNLAKYLKKLVMICREKEMVPIPQPINTNSLLEGKVALITGGSGGIGMGIAKAFVNSGCKVVIAGRNEEKLKNNILKISAGGGGGKVYYP